MMADENAGERGGEPGDRTRRPDGDSGHDRDGQADGGKDKATSDGADEGESGDENRPSPLANPRTRVALIVGAVLAAVALAYWFVHYRAYGRFQQSTNDAYLSADQINVSPRIAGYVEQVLVSDNQVVREGHAAGPHRPAHRRHQRRSSPRPDRARGCERRPGPRDPASAGRHDRAGARSGGWEPRPAPPKHRPRTASTAAEVARYAAAERGGGGDERASGPEPQQPGTITRPGCLRQGAARCIPRAGCVRAP